MSAPYGMIDTQAGPGTGQATRCRSFKFSPGEPEDCRTISSLASTGPGPRPEKNKCYSATVTLGHRHFSSWIAFCWSFNNPMINHSARRMYVSGICWGRFCSAWGSTASLPPLALRILVPFKFDLGTVTLPCCRVSARHCKLQLLVSWAKWGVRILHIDIEFDIFRK